MFVQDFQAGFDYGNQLDGLVASDAFNQEQNVPQELEEEFFATYVDSDDQKRHHRENHDGVTYGRLQKVTFSLLGVVYAIPELVQVAVESDDGVQKVRKFVAVEEGVQPDGYNVDGVDDDENYVGAFVEDGVVSEVDLLVEDECCENEEQGHCDEDEDGSGFGFLELAVGDCQGGGAQKLVLEEDDADAVEELVEDVHFGAKFLGSGLECDIWVVIK